MRASRLGRWVARALVVAAVGSGVMLAGVSAASASAARSTPGVATAFNEWN